MTGDELYRDAAGGSVQKERSVVHGDGAPEQCEAYLRTAFTVSPKLVSML